MKADIIVNEKNGNVNMEIFMPQKQNDEGGGMFSFSARLLDGACTPQVIAT